MGELQLWEKETSVSELQKPFNEEHQGGALVENELNQARTNRDEADEKFENESLSTQIHQHDLRIQETTITEQHYSIQKEKLDGRTGSRIKLEEERKMSTIAKRKAQSTISASQEALTSGLEHENVMHKFMIKDRETEEEKTTVYEALTKVKEELSQSSPYGLKEGLGSELAQAPLTITNKIWAT